LRARRRHPRSGVPYGGAYCPAGRPAKERSSESGIMPFWSGRHEVPARVHRTPPGAATDSHGGFDNNWLDGSMACKQCTLAAEHAAGNRCPIAFLPKADSLCSHAGYISPLCRRLQLFSAQPSERHTLHNPQLFACFGLRSNIQNPTRGRRRQAVVAVYLYGGICHCFTPTS
jgi:hypothetical protein